ncbi:hypothetical protein BD289DRAFT_203682 [Coniella lustricola]|uniref:Peptidase S54 rhomboid domain-containing protein n=1 Tax=Coniella lustricola TaxID=2025994 RepID=A0A2T3ACC0_9PEZI|nr:hypothetical protein BD289DRAFT_203682 [Coniella lustricola]
MSYRGSAIKVLTWGTIGVNVAVFAKWNIFVDLRDHATGRVLKRGEPGYLQARAKHDYAMFDKFTLSKHNIDQGRWYTTLTSAISHRDFVHLLFNMFVFKQAADVASFIGLSPLRFTLLGLGSALGGSAGALYDKNRCIRNGEPDIPSLGASGMVQGMLVATMFAAPWLPMSVMFIPVEISYRTAVLGFIAWDMYNLHSEVTSGKRQETSVKPSPPSTPLSPRSFGSRHSAIPKNPSPAPPEPPASKSNSIHKPLQKSRKSPTIKKRP